MRSNSHARERLMSNLKEKTLGLLGFLLAMSLSTFSAQAQENAVEDAQVEIQEADEDDDTEEVVVTGSRLGKSSYTSISPLQVVTTEASREVGLIDASDILQESNSVSGQQVDLTFAGFVLDNGPGTSTVDLRGLGAGRTLVLVNGRRLSPSGVEGAPSAPDLNLIPGSLVQQYDFLLDGASSIYGSDAVAGVTNVIMRKDFDGLELQLDTSSPQQSGGLSNTLSIAYGQNYDRGFFGLGVEYSKTEEVTLNDRSWTSDCTQHAEIDQAGNVRTIGIRNAENRLMRPSNCRPDGIAGYITLDGGLTFGGPGAVFYQPGQGNFIDDWSIWRVFGTNGDADGDGFNDVDFSDYTINSRENFATLFPEFERTSFMGYGEYTLQGNMNLTPFFEVGYSKTEVELNSGAAQFFPEIPADNPFNPCNPDGAGVDCNLAFDAFFANPSIIALFTEAQGGNPPAAFGLGIGVRGPAGVNVPTTIVTSVRGDRNITQVENDQTRLLGGVKGDIPQIGLGGNNDWKFEAYVSQTKSTGKSSRFGIREDRTNLAATTIEDPSSPTGLRCDGDGDGVRELTEGCFQVNFYAPSLYNGIVGDFATQAERDFLFDSRDFDTTYEQTIGSIFIDGSLFELQGGTAKAGIGYSYRNDKINSIPDDIARDGLFFGFFSDLGAVGEKYTKEVFAEINLPLLAGKPMVEELEVNLSANKTKDELAGSDTTYSVKVGYRPVSNLLLRSTYGTSYRAPNIREAFLAGTTGFGNVADPCIIPLGAYDVFTSTYDPTGDERDQTLLDNCIAQGVDPFSNYQNGNTVFSTEIQSGGATDISSETSDSLSVGFAYEPDFDAFDLNLGATYYRLSIDNAIVEPSAQFIVNDCYGSLTGNSPFCARINRGSDGLISLLEAGFINRDNEKAAGIDINVTLDKDLTIAGRAFDLGIDLAMNRTIERSLTFIDDEGVVDYDNFAGEFGFPDWRGNLGLRLGYNDYRFTWSTFYLGDVEQDAAGIDEFDDISGISDTCLGTARGDLLCRDIGYAASYVRHSASLFYRGDSWTVGGGIRNIFEKEPPFVDATEVTSRSNAPIGYGYDLNGRTFFLSVAKSF